MLTDDRPDAAGAFDAWLDRFLEHLFARRPVDATFAGVNQYNHLLPDVSREGLSATLAEIRSLLSDLAKVDPMALDPYRKIDYDLARGYLDMQAWERSAGGGFDLNPVSYTSEAAFALLSLFLSDTRSMKAKAESLAARLSALPGFFQGAKANLVAAPPLWVDRAVVECQGALAFLTEGIPILAADEGLPVDQALVTDAIAAVLDFRSHLETELRARPSSRYACGEQAFRNILEWAHGTDLDPIAYAAHAEALIDACTAEVSAECRALGLNSLAEVQERLGADHPDGASYLEAYGTQWEQLRRLNEREQWVTWPDFPLVYQPVPRWARASQPHLYFLNYRCPPRYARPGIFRYNVAPMEAGMSPEHQEAFLRNNNHYAIKTNHVLHHGGIGHHVQNWHAMRSRSRIGQISCTDGASRLTMLCAGTLCEGWACYITSLAGTGGFLSPLEALMEKASLRRMAARAVVDIRLHCEIYSMDEAIRFYREKADMSEAFARSEAVKNSLFPGGAIMYLQGVEGIEELKDQIRQKQGEAFSLKAFHDTLLSYGGVPVARISKEMKAS